MINTFLVLGPGRCGTSAVARMLHEHFNISMGEHFRKPDELNPRGYYEDLEFKNPNEFLITGNIIYPEWAAIIEREVNKRAGDDWGLKDPRLCYLLGNYFCYVENPIFIRCTRDLNAIADSMQKSYGWDRMLTVKVVMTRERFLNRMLTNRAIYTINFTNIRTDDEIINELKRIPCLKQKP